MKQSPVAPEMPEHQQTSTAVKIEQMLTEARVLIPGAQALLGFQFIATLTSAFDELPLSFRLVHLVALCAIALAALLLMTPAAVHRIAFDWEDTIDSTLLVRASSYLPRSLWLLESHEISPLCSIAEPAMAR